MSPERPDPALLDDLVSGLDGGDEADEAWQWLVRSPDGTAAWERAAARRRGLDRLAVAVAGRAWLARLLRMVRRARSASSAVPAFSIRVNALDPAAALLGPADSDGAHEIPVRWREVQIVEVAPGHRVRVVRDPARADIVFYRYAKGEGALAGAWDMEPGDAPVLITICRDAAGAATADDALGRASDAAAVVLVEPPLPGESPDDESD